MNNMFSGKQNKKIPATLHECTQPDSTADNLHLWAERLEGWGQRLFIILIVIGIISTIANVIMVAEEEELILTTLISSIITWGLAAFIEYCTYHVLALIISALASITQSTIISANVALYESARNAGQLPTAEPVSKTAAPAQTASSYTAPAYTAPQPRPTSRTSISPEGMWFCVHCGTQNKMQYGQCKKCGKYKS